MAGLLRDWGGRSRGHAEELSAAKSPPGHANGRKMAWPLPTDPALYIPVWWRGRRRWWRWMKKKKIQEQKTKVSALCGTPHECCSKQSAWHGMKRTWQDLLGRVFSDPYPAETMCLLHEETENFGLQFVKRKQKTNFIKTELFSFQIVNVYKCNACGCVRSCVIGKVVPASSYYWEVFPAWAPPKAHGRSLFVPLR